MDKRKSNSLVAGLGAVILAVAVMQSGIVPILSSIGTQLQVSPSTVSWVVTANLIAAAAGTPLLGRLSDVFNKKTVLLGALALVLAGTMIGALATSLPLLVFARALQGTSFALYPIAASILRHELAADRLVRGIAVLSAMLGFGGAIGLVATGTLLTDGVGYQRIFWVHAALVFIVLVIAAVTVPRREQRTSAHVDWVGAAGLALGLSGVLLAISKGAAWGWTSPATIIAAAGGVGVLAMWVRWTGRAADPLVSLTMLRRRPVLLANSASFLIGLGSYISFLGLTHFVQCPSNAGFGFNASVAAVSMKFLLPGALAGTITAVIAGRAIERFGARAVVAAGGLSGVLGFAMLTFWHSQAWQVVLAGVLTNVYLSLAYGALPAMIIGDVEPGETGVATSLNGTFSKMAGSTAAAMVGAVLAPLNGGHPVETGFTVVFVAGIVTAGLVMVLASPQSQLLRRKVTYRRPQMLVMSSSTAG